MNETFDFSTILEPVDVVMLRRSGELIIEAGTPGTDMFVLKSGEALIIVGDIVLETVSKGGIIGEIAMLDDSARSANVVAGTQCELVPIDRERCFSLFREKPVFATELMKLIARRLRAMNFLARHDAMTRLPNRASLEEHLSLALSRAHRNKTVVGIMALDLAGFGVINVLFGHAVGDRLMLSAATRLRAVARKADFVARVGGDQFAIAMEGATEVQNAVTLAQKIIEEMARPFSLAGHNAELSPSIGISYYPQDGSDEKTLLQAASSAASRAKEQGGHTYQFFSPELNKHALETLTITNKLRLALEREEFVLHYLPRIDLLSGKVIGVEALIRWNEPEMGLISPAMFIPLAEKRGMINAIGEWVLKTACRQASEWQNAGVPPLLIAVNISLGQLRQADLPARIEEILRAANLSAKWLELEVTESIAMSDAEKTVIALKAMSDMGLALAIDDFGTGYSSLSYLKRFPINYLKIDQSFVRGIPSDPSDVAIVKTIIAMAKNLGMRLIAEGVETREQLAFLRSEGCEEAQGYLFSRPLPAADLARFLRDRNHG